MNPTSYGALAGVAVFCAAAAAILTWRFYGLLPPVPMSVGITLGLIAVICVVLAVKIRARLKDGRIGQDRSQLNPITASQFLVIGKASEWTGAILGGAYLGMGLYVLPNSATLLAAADDRPAVLAAIIGSLALCAAGIYLERSCHLPPPTDSETVG
ncbi:DUF3180 family protein [Corynebacterium poyangense]|uniref:DUF3180 family protein n=1 Tax=Corynebacterium poyangense TaxID=2684405 RepID=A0A7H0SR69_9CORY|nr:DUF3180 domain-containing protein [Corynebacterium poyangense]MBZ8176472.1 DUF3180 family protein [Corynebacterium poyangense]QNQ91044.1 DUF3180 family protein [Corynebacterium poyangense]